MSKLYHTEVFLPAKLKTLPRCRIAITPSEHAKRAAKDDRYGNVPIPSHIEFDGRNIIEAEIDGGRVLKLVVRLALNAVNDVIYVVMPETGLLKTTWINRRSDLHRTLDRSRYASA